VEAIKDVVKNPVELITKPVEIIKDPLKAVRDATGTKPGGGETKFVATPGCNNGTDNGLLDKWKWLPSPGQHVPGWEKDKERIGGTTFPRIDTSQVSEWWKDRQAAASSWWKSRQSAAVDYSKDVGQHWGSVRASTGGQAAGWAQDKWNQVGTHWSNVAKEQGRRVASGRDRLTPGRLRTPVVPSIRWPLMTVDGEITVEKRYDGDGGTRSSSGGQDLGGEAWADWATETLQRWGWIERDDDPEEDEGYDAPAPRSNPPSPLPGPTPQPRPSPQPQPTPQPSPVPIPGPTPEPQPMPTIPSPNRLYPNLEVAKGTTDGVDGELLDFLDAVGELQGSHLKITSGFRTKDEQAQDMFDGWTTTLTRKDEATGERIPGGVYGNKISDADRHELTELHARAHDLTATENERAEAKAKFLDRVKLAYAGGSQHEQGKAIDLASGTVTPEADAILKEYLHYQSEGANGACYHVDTRLKKSLPSKDELRRKWDSLK
jgi:hypothetical protein